MTDSPTLPDIKTATQFADFMEEVWRMDCAPTDEGGVILSGSDLYERFHNARGAAEYFGAKWKYPSKVDGLPGYCYEFADGSRVAINTKGDALQPVNRHGSHQIAA